MPGCVMDDAQIAINALSVIHGDLTAMGLQKQSDDLLEAALFVNAAINKITLAKTKATVSSFLRKQATFGDLKRIAE